MQFNLIYFTAQFLHRLPFITIGYFSAILQFMAILMILATLQMKAVTLRFVIEMKPTLLRHISSV